MKINSVFPMKMEANPASVICIHFFYPDFFYVLIVGIEGYWCAWSLSVTHTRSVGPPWTRDRPSQRPLPDNKQHSQETDIHARDGIRNYNPTKRAVVDTRLRPHGHGDRRFCGNYIFKIYRIKSVTVSLLFLGFPRSVFPPDLPVLSFVGIFP
jgi:hypothetical protein